MTDYLCFPFISCPSLDWTNIHDIIRSTSVGSLVRVILTGSCKRTIIHHDHQLQSRLVKPSWLSRDWCKKWSARAESDRGSKVGKKYYFYYAPLRCLFTAKYHFKMVYPYMFLDFMFNFSGCIFFFFFFTALRYFIFCLVLLGNGSVDGWIWDWYWAGGRDIKGLWRD